jgi:ATP-dependent RNA helicase DDX46/PRP5
MDDSVETKRKLEVLGDMPAVDTMTMVEGGASVEDGECKRRLARDGGVD